MVTEGRVWEGVLPSILAHGIDHSVRISMVRFLNLYVIISTLTNGFTAFGRLGNKGWNWDMFYEYSKKSER